MPTSTLRYSRFATDSDEDTDFEEEPQSPSPPARGYPPNYKKITPVRTVRHQAASKTRGTANGLLYHRANAVSSPKVAPVQPSPDLLPHIIGLGSTRGAPSGTSISSIGSPGSSGSLRGSKGGSPRGGRRLSWDSSSGLVRPRLRRQHSHPLREHQTWHTHPLIRPLMQLVPEAFLSFLLWSLLVQFWGDVYWYQLQAGGLSPTLFYLLYLLTPALALGLPPVRTALAAFPWTRALLVVGGLLGMAGQLGNSSLYRLTLAGSAVGVMGTLMWDNIWAGTAARRRRTGFGMAGGALLLQSLTYAYGGRNPAAASWWTFLLVAALPGVLAVATVLYEDAVGWAAREGGMARLDEEHGEAGVEAFSDIGMDDVLSNDDWDESEVEAALLLQARLQNGGFTGTSGSGPNSPLVALEEGLRLTAGHSPPASHRAHEAAGGDRNGLGARTGLRAEHTGLGEDWDGRGEAARQKVGPKRPHAVAFHRKDGFGGQDGYGGTGSQVENEIEALEIGTTEAAEHSSQGNMPKVNHGKRLAEVGTAHCAHSRHPARTVQEIEMGSVQEPSGRREPAGATGQGQTHSIVGNAKGRTQQGLKRGQQTAPETSCERDTEAGPSSLHGPHGDIESGLSGESQAESWDGEGGEREAEPMVTRDAAEGTESWHFLPKKVIDLGRRFGEGEEVPWQQAVREETPFSEQDAEFEVFRERGRRWTKAGILHTLQMGLSLGSLLFVTHWLLTAPTLPARWAGVSPWWGVLSPLSLTAGIAIAAEAAKFSKHLHGFGAWGVAAVGCLLLLLGAVGGVLGGALLALATPSLWVVLSRNTVNVYPGMGTAIAALVHVVLALWSAMVVAYGNVPGALFLRGSAPVLMVVALGGVALGLGRGPPLSAEDRRLLGAMLGAWKAGRPSWGSGVPGRKAVAALAALVGSLLLAAVVHRLLALPVAYHSAPGDSLRVLSFNVNQGYNRAGGNNFKAIQNVIREQKPHFIMLQETDTMRIMQGNRDMVDYLSLGLRMYSLAHPPTRRNTWGCATLSKFPFQSQMWEVLPSDHGEAACFQHATVQVGGDTVHLMNAHLSENGRDQTAQAETVARHIRAVADSSIADRTQESPAGDGNSTFSLGVRVPIVLAGDLNSAPLSPQYMEIVSAGVDDARVQVQGQWQSPEKRDPGAGIVFVSSALNCTKWVEPQYEQRKTADGFPIVVTFKLKGNSL